MAANTTTKGTSLAKGPIGLIGLVLLGYGITALIFGGHSFTTHAPTGAIAGKTWLGLEVNGWTGLLFVAAGLPLLLGAPLHWGAKTMSFIVGISLVVLCLIALTNGHGALGIFAANGLTELVWGAGGALLIVLSLLPRVGRKTARTVRSEPARERKAAVEQPRSVEQPRLTTYGAREGSAVARD